MMSQCWMFHIFGYDNTVFEYLNAHIGENYLRGYVTDDDYLLGYILLANEYQDLVDVLGSLSYPWRFDGMMLNLIDEHVTNQVKTVSLGNMGLRTELLHESIPFCSCNVTITQMWEYLKDILPSAYYRDINFMAPLR